MRDSWLRPEVAGLLPLQHGGGGVRPLDVVAVIPVEPEVVGGLWWLLSGGRGCPVSRSPGAGAPPAPATAVVLSHRHPGPGGGEVEPAGRQVGGSRGVAALLVGLQDGENPLTPA